MESETLPGSIIYRPDRFTIFLRNLDCMLRIGRIGSSSHSATESSGIGGSGGGTTVGISSRAVCISSTVGITGSCRRRSGTTGSSSPSGKSTTEHSTGCIGFVYLYLKDVAYGASNTNVWNTTITPYAGFYAPSFAILRSDDDAAYAEFSTIFKPQCNYPAINKHDCASNLTEVSFNSQVYGNLRGYIFNGSDVFLKNSYEKVLLKLFVNYNSANISKEHENPSPQNPYLYFVVFDSALGSAPDHARFKEALDCGVIALSEMPALGSTTLSAIPYAVDDTLNALKLNDTTCIDIYNHGQRHLYYMSQLASTGVLTSSSCDVSIDRSKPSQPFQDCICQVIIRYGTTYLTTYNSKRQKEATDILIDMGGIVGGVCFVFWFWGIFAVQ